MTARPGRLALGDTLWMNDSARRIALLAKVGALAGPLGYDEVLAATARLSIPEFADWCIVDVVEHGELRRVEVAHRDPSRAAFAERLRRHPPPPRDPAREGLLSGRALLVPDYTDEVAIAHSWPPVLLALVGDLGVRSLLVVPLVVDDTVVGVWTFAMTTESDRRYREEDLALAEELARRAGAVVENARLHQELKRSERRFRVALANTHVSVFETDRELRYSWVYNPMFGLHAEDLLGKSPASLVRPDEAAHIEARKRLLLESGEPRREEIRLTIDGITRHCLVHIEPLRGPSGEVVGITGVATDVTVQKQVQEKLGETLAFRDRMLGILGHDLRNPASAVAMIASALLKREDVAGRSREGIVQMRGAAVRMLEMITSLLDFSESRFRGALPISPARTDLHQVTRAVVQELAATHPGRHVDVSTRGDGVGCWDPARMAQVVSNLLSNALTHGTPGEPVRLSVEGDQDELRLSVWNTGAPIPPELIPVLFEPFRRGAASGGLGLGLYIVQQIVIAHGGEIDVSSDANRGTTVAVRLPRWRAGSVPPGTEPRTTRVERPAGEKG